MQTLRERDHWGGIRIKVLYTRLSILMYLYLSSLLQIHRTAIFEESYNQLHHRTSDEMRGRINVTFYGEEGIDAGGLLREWYALFVGQHSTCNIHVINRYLVLSREMFNPGYALFKPSAADNVTFQPNPQSSINPDHLFYFRFIGRIIGKALFDGQMLDAYLCYPFNFYPSTHLQPFFDKQRYFTRSFYKHMLGVSVNYTDMEAIDPEYYKVIFGFWVSGLFFLYIFVNLFVELAVDLGERYHKRTRSHLLSRNPRV